MGLIELAKSLIACPSITPDDQGCQQIIAKRLTDNNFTCQSLPFEDVSNLWATHGNGQPVVVFAGHTDVVPPGPLDQWLSPPFQPEIRDGILYGRGVADMKGALAAMMIAAENFVTAQPDHVGTIAFLITSDEEGSAQYGTKKVIDTLQQKAQPLDYCIVGEASSEHQLGDTIKIGRRGSLSGKLTIQGKQGHIAYPQLASNAIHLALPALNALIQQQWDNGNTHFPATSLQISNIYGGTGAKNMIPDTIEIDFNFRYSPETNAKILQQHVKKIISEYHDQFTIAWQHSGNPFLTNANSPLTAVAKQAVKQVTGLIPKTSTAGGTSDGRFIAPTGCHVIELGAINKTIHQINECTPIKDLEDLVTIYQHILTNILTIKKS